MPCLIFSSRQSPTYKVILCQHDISLNYEFIYFDNEAKSIHVNVQICVHCDLNGYMVPGAVKRLQYKRVSPRKPHQEGLCSPWEVLQPPTSHLMMA